SGTTSSADANGSDDGAADSGDSEDGTSAGEIALFVLIALVVIGTIVTLIVRMRRQQLATGRRRTGSDGSGPRGCTCRSGRRLPPTGPCWSPLPTACSRCIPGRRRRGGWCAPPIGPAAPPRPRSTRPVSGSGGSTTSPATSTAGGGVSPSTAP